MEFISFVKVAGLDLQFLQIKKLNGKCFTFSFANFFSIQDSTREQLLLTRKVIAIMLNNHVWLKEISIFAQLQKSVTYHDL